VAVAVVLMALVEQVMAAQAATRQEELLAAMLQVVLTLTLPRVEAAERIQRGVPRELEMEAPQWQVDRFQVVPEPLRQEVLAVAVPQDRPMVVQVVPIRAQRAVLVAVVVMVTTAAAVVVVM
jgi:hypothetical protein